jgi:hypothetical protein
MDRSTTAFPVTSNVALAVTRHALATRMLRWAGTGWVAVALAGQLLFAIYVVDFYGSAAVTGQWQRWNTVLVAGYIPGDALGNSVLAIHLLCAAVVMLSGTVQLLPFVRRRWPRLHRLNGRLFLGVAVLAAIGGTYMIWTRHVAGDTLAGRLSMTLDALLIVGFAERALRHARARRFDAHRRWALRLYLAVSGVWFFRVGLMLWLIVNQGPVGFDPKTFTGPFLTFLGFAEYLLPLAVLQLYFMAERRGSALHRVAMAATLAGLTLAMAIGIAGAFTLMWLPNL